MSRSARWFAQDGVGGFIHRASMRAEGLGRAAMDGRPVVGICNCWSELVSCNLHFRSMAEAIKRGVLLAGGLPVEFPVITLGENLMKPTAMLYRNLMSMDVEESIRAYPFDAVVLMGGCDKTTPAQLMGAASAGVPAIMVTGGPSQPARFRGRRLGNGTDLWRYTDEVRAGTMSRDEFRLLEEAATPSVGHCTEMGTASTMAAMAEALGMALPGSSTIPATHAGRLRACEDTGARAVALASTGGPTPAEVMTEDAFHNALTVLAGLGGSTNAVIHLVAIAGRLGVELGVDTLDAVLRRTPVVADVRPAGSGLVEDLHEAGGIPAVMSALEPLLRTEAVTVTGQTVRAALVPPAGSCVASLDRPVKPAGSLAVLRGNLAPLGALVKAGAATPGLLEHSGPAVVFDGMADMLARIDDDSLPVTADSVLVLRNAGPRAVPGMPEWGQLPIPRKLLAAGVTDMVRLSDARMSGTAFGTVVLHVAPEAGAGGPLALVRDGDPISLSLRERALTLDVPESVLTARRASARPPAPARRRGYQRLYVDHVLQADQGCDFDFLRYAADDEPIPDGPIDTGWAGGW
ncbi:dihydroxy-acid dehydratase [Pseudonocardia acaciae]|uniref:dihydroxy-acid dehydratase n=1 Tax=Pseudonocardia acaciae TaxID=551276 RepID=UPI000490627F|nr:dihydroxy-acid dehydratase [Pseudonocardia acaciae]